MQRLSTLTHRVSGIAQEHVNINGTGTTSVCQHSCRRNAALAGRQHRVQLEYIIPCSCEFIYNILLILNASSKSLAHCRSCLFYAAYFTWLKRMQTITHIKRILIRPPLFYPLIFRVHPACYTEVLVCVHYLSDASERVFHSNYMTAIRLHGCDFVVCVIRL